jgi:hypothetical protein
MVRHTHARRIMLPAVHFGLSEAGSRMMTQVLAHAQVPVIRQAFQVSQQGIPGPVFVELPVDLTWPAKEVIKTTESMMPRAGKLLSNLIRCCLDNNHTPLAPDLPHYSGCLLLRHKTLALKAHTGPFNLDAFVFSSGGISTGLLPTSTLACLLLPTSQAMLLPLCLCKSRQSESWRLWQA